MLELYLSQCPFHHWQLLKLGILFSPYLLQYIVLMMSIYSPARSLCKPKVCWTSPNIIRRVQSGDNPWQNPARHSIVYTYTSDVTS
jgi:hypothetical protein